MNVFEKLKGHLSNFDPNTAFSTVMATIASVTVDNLMGLVYLVIAAFTSYHSVRMSVKRMELEVKKSDAEAERIDIENESLKMANEEKRLKIDAAKAALTKPNDVA